MTIPSSVSEIFVSVPLKSRAGVDGREPRRSLDFGQFIINEGEILAVEATTIETGSREVAA